MCKLIIYTTLLIWVSDIQGFSLGGSYAVQESSSSGKEGSLSLESLIGSGHAISHGEGLSLGGYGKGVTFGGHNAFSSEGSGLSSHGGYGGFSLGGGHKVYSFGGHSLGSFGSKGGQGGMSVQPGAHEELFLGEKHGGHGGHGDDFVSLTHHDLLGRQAFKHFDHTPIHLGTVSGPKHLPPKIIRITKTVAIKVPVPYPVKIPHHVPYPVPVPKPYPVHVEKIVKVPEHSSHESGSSSDHASSGFEAQHLHGYGGSDSSDHDSYSQIALSQGYSLGHEGKQETEQGHEYLSSNSDHYSQPDISGDHSGFAGSSFGTSSNHDELSEAAGHGGGESYSYQSAGSGSSYEHKA